MMVPFALLCVVFVLVTPVVVSTDSSVDDTCLCPPSSCDTVRNANDLVKTQDGEFETCQSLSMGLDWELYQRLCCSEKPMSVVRDGYVVLLGTDDQEIVRQPERRSLFQFFYFGGHRPQTAPATKPWMSVFELKPTNAQKKKDEKKDQQQQQKKKDDKKNTRGSYPSWNQQQGPIIVVNGGAKKAQQQQHFEAPQSQPQPPEQNSFQMAPQQPSPGLSNPQQPRCQLPSGARWCSMVPCANPNHIVKEAERVIVQTSSGKPTVYSTCKTIEYDLNCVHGIYEGYQDCNPSKHSFRRECCEDPDSPDYEPFNDAGFKNFKIRTGP